jgi:NAD(P)H-flavin reductase
LTPAAQSVTVAYGARMSRLLIYRDIVDRCAEKVSSVQVLYFVENGAIADAPDDVRVFSEAGRVSVAATWPRLAHPFEAAYYISGPPIMLQTIRHDLRARGVSPEAIYIDAWE